MGIGSVRVGYDFFEHGIKVGADDPRPSRLDRIASTQLPVYAFCTVTVVDRDGSSLNQRALQALDVPSAHRVADYYEEQDLRYSLRSALYHLDRVIGFYVEKCALFEEMDHPVGTFSGNTHESRIYFEVDALLAAARRTYDFMANLLWKHYSPPGRTGRWRSIRTAVKSEGVLPPDVAEWLRDSWSEVGLTAGGYRDCLMHHAPLTNGNETCWMHRYGNRWGATVRLPVPGSQSRREYDLENGPDALKYCHGLVAQLVGLCEQAGQLDPIAAYLSSPPGYS